MFLIIRLHNVHHYIAFSFQLISIKRELLYFFCLEEKNDCCNLKTNTNAFCYNLWIYLVHTRLTNGNKGYVNNWCQLKRLSKWKTDK